MPVIKSKKNTKTNKIKKATNLVAIKSAKKPNLPTKTKQKVRETEKKKILASWKQIGLSLGKIIANA